MIFRFSVVAVFWLAAILVAIARAEVTNPAPIVIKTPVANYAQPTFDDYKNCMKALDECEKLCDGTVDCLAKCKKCPVLLSQDVVVQGVNDTDYQTMPQITVNSTNVIRLTNEIHNIIENNLGDINTKNENHVHIYPEHINNNNTAACDKFGLGCNENGTCCYIVKNRHREKHCGNRCQARVMYEKTIVQCGNDTNLNSCKKIIEYKPMLRKRTKHTLDNHLCRYDRQWPFVSCSDRKPVNERCSAICLSISYLYILQHGVPLKCINCYKSFGESSNSYTPPIAESDRPQFDPRDKEWILEKTKCRKSDGTISEDCTEKDTQNSQDHNNDVEELGSGDDEVGHTNIDVGLESFQSLKVSKPPNTFRRSKYSLRNRQKEVSND